jgi:putative transposase
MITAGTYKKRPLFNTPAKRTIVLDLLFKYAHRFEWNLQAWAVMNNHYHFVALSPADPGSLRVFVGRFHEYSAKKLNSMDSTPGRKVWHNYWDTHITHQTSYYARLRYVHQNPVHHGLTENASNYPWCSQSWLEKKAPRSFVNTLARFKTDRVNVMDEF